MNNSKEEIIRSFIDFLEKESYSKEELYGALKRYTAMKNKEEDADKLYKEREERINFQIMKNTDTSDIPPAGCL